MVKQGPAYPWGVKILASILFFTLLYLTFEAFRMGRLEGLSMGARGAWGVCWGMCIFGYGWILKSQTMIDESFITQQWIYTKRVRIDHITQVHLIRIRHCEGWITPRLRVRSDQGTQVFHTASPEVLAAFDHLAHGVKGLH